VDLTRFIAAQKDIYGQALAELRQGRKQSHWMWFVFPQIAGLGRSPTARLYALASADEARAFLAHPLLGKRLRECTAAILVHREQGAEAIFGAVDAMKLRSSMTLFEAVADNPAPFAAALAAFHEGERDAATLRLIGR
jgi:uncharacterized protein (DUF1810 family)